MAHSLKKDCLNFGAEPGILSTLSGKKIMSFSNVITQELGYYNESEVQLRLHDGITIRQVSCRRTVTEFTGHAN